MAITKVEVTIVKLISILGTLQGLAWATLSFVAIIMYNVSSDITFSNSYPQLLETSFYYRYLKEMNSTEVNLYSNVVIRPSDFTVFMWIYFLSSATWVALSIDQYIAVRNDKNRLSTVMILWSIDTILFSILDIILMSLLARDYQNCSSLELLGVANLYSVLCYTVSGITMTLAARGFLLWIINIACCIALLSMGIRIKKLAYAHKNLVIPRVKLGSDSGNGNSWRNSNFQPAPDNNANGGDAWRSPGGFLGEPQYLRENKRFA